MTIETKFEVIFKLHNRDFSQSFGKHYTTLDRVINGDDTFDYSSNDVIAKRLFTGVKDQHDNEIYEGDIILSCAKRCEAMAAFYKVHYDKVYGSFVGHFVATAGGNEKQPNFPLGELRFEAEVAGNIYENPEYLENND